MTKDFRLILGLEIHLHVKTAKKMFCNCSADIYSAEPNTHVCPTCLGLPGALPVPNKHAVELTQLLGIALGCTLNLDSRFDRKHYFYHDLPKGYQLSQYDQPLCVGGSLKLRNGKTIELERIHLEEDTAKSFHSKDDTLIDFNKSGMPLIEVVTKPVITSAEDAAEFGRMLRDLARFLNISDADMEKGQMRVEPNISVRTVEMERANELPEYKVEVKNINSFKAVEKAAEYEIARHIELLEAGRGDEIVQETRGWDENKQITFS
ncbi:MAG TPA: Asp-tRNA(Asn)/Glu-tRNA(Gln) amidotransferase subunit GatB, partial [bacterium]|nr:Asp-tRNA(Asn)/Glu-tRNA(Gln) amidotransferase subunit GatB [bacterium]